jgi:hypothetical protein
MCWPVAIAVASATASFIGQRQQARAQRQYQEIAAKQEQQRFLQEQSAMLTRTGMEMEAREAEAFKAEQMAKASIARARVAAGEAGVAGQGIDVMIGDYYRQLGDYRTALTKERGYQDIATGLALSDIGMRSQQNLIGIRRPVNEPSLLEGVASIASAGMQGAAQAAQMQAASGGLPSGSGGSTSAFQTTAFDKNYQLGFG